MIGDNEPHLSLSIGHLLRGGFQSFCTRHILLDLLPGHGVNVPSLQAAPHCSPTVPAPRNTGKVGADGTRVSLNHCSTNRETDAREDFPKDKHTVDGRAGKTLVSLHLSTELLHHTMRTIHSFIRRFQTELPKRAGIQSAHMYEVPTLGQRCLDPEIRTPCTSSNTHQCPPLPPQDCRVFHYPN